MQGAFLNFKKTKTARPKLTRIPNLGLDFSTVLCYSSLMNEKLSNSKIWFDDYSASIENWAKDNGLLSPDGEEVGNRDQFLPTPHFEDGE